MNSTSNELLRASGLFLGSPSQRDEIVDYARRIVRSCPFAVFIGIQEGPSAISEPLVLIGHQDCPRGATVAIPISQLNAFSVMLSVIAQHVRYFPRAI